MPRRRPRAASLSRPAGLARGVGGFIATWFGGLVIALLTGATAVVILLAVASVAALAAGVSGAIALRRTNVLGVVSAEVATVAAETVWVIHSRTVRPVHAELRVADQVVARGWLTGGADHLTGHAPRRGVHTEATVTWSTAGPMGMVWWRRRQRFAIGPMHVAPAPAATPAPATQAIDLAEGALASTNRLGHDDVDGIRQWRDGDAVEAVHWPSTLRAGELVIRQRRRDVDERWVVDARTGTGDPDGEAARVRRALDDCLSRGAVAAVSVDGGQAVDLRSPDAALRWTAAFEPHEARDRPVPFWQRQIVVGRGAEPDTTLTPRARWAVAVAGLPSLLMLLGPLGYGAPEQLVVALMMLAGAAATSARRPLTPWIRQLAGLAAGAVVAMVLVDLAGIESVVTAMRFLMPQILVALCVVQGFECIDRRGARVAMACSGLLACYAAGVRVDEALGVYLLVTCVGLGIATATVTAPDRHRRAPSAANDARPSRRDVTTRVVGALVAVGALVTVLVLVPVPKGPAQLTLPSWLENRRPVQSPGDLSRPDGSPLLGGPVQGGGLRTGAGAGGYPGFSSTMDTSLRGDLGDEVVLRVRAPSADYWKGQTFMVFDGRTWYVEPSDGDQESDGTDHLLGVAEGEIDSDSMGDFIQTYYVETDLPNLVFAAQRPVRLLLDATVYRRPDGAIRSDVVLTKGSAYTVLSHRTDATAKALRAQGDLTRFQMPPRFLQLPDTVTPRTRDLARQLATGTTSTYDTVIAIEQWLATHVEYDLDAPVPAPGADAVDDFLFRSRRGFCEQIASATAVMLRTLGIPARIATGYVPSSRDEVAGVWISRARDAHAWVEVWFPRYGWIAFDPTASVPLAGDSARGSIGTALLKDLLRVVGDHIVLLLGAALGLGLVVVLGRATRAAWRRHRRGRWGVLQDRFVAAAIARGAPPHAPNAGLAAVFGDDATVQAAATVARTLDECAFSPGWTEDDERYDWTADAVRVLERSR